MRHFLYESPGPNRGGARTAKDRAMQRKFPLLFAAVIVSLGAASAFVPYDTRLARADADIDVGGSGTALIAGINVGEPSSDEVSGCTWHTTVISGPSTEPYSYIYRNGVKYRWYARVCRTRLTGEGSDITFHWIPVVSETTMANQASKYAFGLIPVPLVGTSPPAHRGVVNLPMWWWVSPSTWRTVSVTVGFLPCLARSVAVELALVARRSVGGIDVQLHGFRRCAHDEWPARCRQPDGDGNGAPCRW